MNISRWTIVKNQVDTFWLSMEVAPDDAKRQYPLTFAKLKRKVERKLNLQIEQIDGLTSAKVEKFLRDNDLFDQNLVPPDPSDSQLAGALFAVADVGIVFVPKDEEPKTRKLFSLAHELGHYFIEVYMPFVQSGKLAAHALFYRDAVGLVSRTSEGALTVDSFTEYKANQFAAELLMPRDFVLARFHQIWKRRKKGVPQGVFIEQLMNTFGVSERAAQVRIQDLGIECR
jgi:hypothetical protein